MAVHPDAIYSLSLGGATDIGKKQSHSCLLSKDQYIGKIHLPFTFLQYNSSIEQDSNRLFGAGISCNRKWKDMSTNISSHHKLDIKVAHALEI
jgi:hypothetical protein